MRYWKGDYDEDCARDHHLRRHDLRRAHGTRANDEDTDMRVFQVLVGIQIFMFILAGLLFVSSR